MTASTTKGTVMADHWVSDRPSSRSSLEGVLEVPRCRGCGKLFRRPKGSQQGCPNCAAGTPCTTNASAGQWQRS